MSRREERAVGREARKRREEKREGSGREGKRGRRRREGVALLGSHFSGSAPASKAEWG